MLRIRRLRLGVSLLAVGVVPRARAAISENAYVWQRSWTKAVDHSVAEHASSFAQLDVLAAEVSLPDATQYPRIAWDALAAARRPVALVIRLQHFPRGASGEVVQVAREVLRRAQAGQVVPAELQIDFDCASSRLPEYLALVDALRQQVHPPRLTITALPDWLNQPAFNRLAEAVDGFVLQVHSVDRPSINRPIVLCDPKEAAMWIRRASGIGRPFRIALPDYGYEVGFDSRGILLGLQAEGGERAWPEGAVVRRVMADPASIANLVATLRSAPPPNLQAIAWFRLPMPNDTLCWPWATLSAVRRGRAPVARFALRLSKNADGATDLFIANVGDGAATPPLLPIHVARRQLLALDLAPGWRTKRDGAGNVWIGPATAAAADPIAPGESMRVGWLRLIPSAHVAETN